MASLTHSLTQEEEEQLRMTRRFLPEHLIGDGTITEVRKSDMGVGSKFGEVRRIKSSVFDTLPL